MGMLEKVGEDSRGGMEDLVLEKEIKSSGVARGVRGVRTHPPPEIFVAPFFPKTPINIGPHIPE